MAPAANVSWSFSFTPPSLTGSRPSSYVLDPPSTYVPAPLRAQCPSVLRAQHLRAGHAPYSHGPSPRFPAQGLRQRVSLRRLVEVVGGVGRALCPSRRAPRWGPPHLPNPLGFRRAALASSPGPRATTWSGLGPPGLHPPGTAEGGPALVGPRVRAGRPPLPSAPPGGRAVQRRAPVPRAAVDRRRHRHPSHLDPSSRVQDTRDGAPYDRPPHRPSVDHELPRHEPRGRRTEVPVEPGDTHPGSGDPAGADAGQRRAHRRSQ